MSNYISRHYDVPAEPGRRVVVDGKPGIIVDSSTHYLSVNFDEDDPGVTHRCHPTWRVTYLGMGAIRKPRPLSRRKARSKARYKRFLCYGEGFDDFLDFCRWDAQAEHPWNKGVVR